MNIRHDMIECFIVRPAGASCEFLQLRRASGEYMAGLWHTVAGKIEAGETAVAAALREMRQETGLSPVELYCLDRIGSFFIPTDDTLWHSILFCAVADEGASVELNEEHDAFRWIGRDEIEGQWLWPSDRESVRQICAEILDDGPAKSRMRVGIG